MNVAEVCDYLETLAPPSLQESYDNSGLLVGNRSMVVTGIMVSLDAVEAVLDEAIQKGCNMVVSHHPIVFSGLKRLNGSNYIERVVMKAIKHDVALYAIHTNLDSVMHGVNKRIADRLGLKNLSILQPKKDQLIKLQVFTPKSSVEQVRNAIFNAGGGHLGEYSHCSFNTEGVGTFLPGKNATPHVGKRGELHRESETKVEVVMPRFVLKSVVKAMLNAHPYEEVAYDTWPLEQSYDKVGAGMVGELKEEMTLHNFLTFLKDKMEVTCIRHTVDIGSKVSRVAVCGGSGSFLLSDAKRQKADIFVTSDYKYHQFFDADGEIVIADIGHYESERFTIDLLGERLREKFPKFALHFTGVNTNPVNYF